MFAEYLQFVWLLVFGNIENLILASQGEVKNANVLSLSIVSVVVVILWFILGTIATDAAMQYENVINFLGGLAIFILGIQSMVEAYKSIKAKRANQ